jgi:uroporphyrinogen-III decarboxylase
MMTDTESSVFASTRAGFNYEASAARICGTYRREDVDRVPIMKPIPWRPADDIDAREFGDWRDEERYRRIARLVQDYCDVLPPYNRVEYPAVFEPLSYQRFIEAPAEHWEELPIEQLSETRKRYTTVLHTPKGDLQYVYDMDDGVFTNWDKHKPIQCAEDVDRMLSVPYKFTPPDASEFEAFRQHRAQMGPNAIGGAGVNCMVAMLCGVMSYQQLLEWIITEPDLIKRLADAWLERVSGKVQWLLSQGVGPFWHFNGIERACPPMMGPTQWEEYILPYDGEIMRMIKAADPDAKIHVHCHANVGAFLDMFVDLGVDSTDPVEPPPQGNVNMAEAKQKYDGKLVFYGNIEFLDMETRQPDEIEELVRSAIEDGGRKNVILWPSSGPHERPTDLFLANAERYIEAGLKYGGR